MKFSGMTHKHPVLFALPLCAAAIGASSSEERQRNAFLSPTLQIARWKGGASGAVALYYDDGTRSALSNAVPVLGAYSVPGTFYLCPGWFEGRDESLVAAWRAAFRDNPGIVVPGNHTWSHSGAKDEEQLRDEIARGDAATREIAGVPPRALLSFAIPGGVPWRISMETLRKELGGRANVLRPGPGSFAAADRDRPGDFLRSARDIAEKVYDRAEREGSLLPVLFHGVGGDWFAFPSEEHEAAIRDVAERRAAGRLWPASTIAAQKYAAERDAATVSPIGTCADRSAAADGSDASFRYRFSVSTDPEVYDEPLTFVISAHESWDAVAVDVVPDTADGDERESGIGGARHFEIPLSGGKATFDAAPRPAEIRLCAVRSASQK